MGMGVQIFPGNQTTTKLQYHSAIESISQSITSFPFNLQKNLSPIHFDSTNNFTKIPTQTKKKR